MNLLLHLTVFSFVLLAPNTANENKQEEVLQTIFEIEEFQKHLTYSPRFVSTSTPRDLYLLSFPELESKALEIKVRDKSVRIVTKDQLQELKQYFYIEVEDFEIKKGKAHVLLYYNSRRLYFEDNQKVSLDTKLSRNKSGEWMVTDYKIRKTSLNTSD